MPLNLQAYSHKGQKGTGEETGSWSQGGKTTALQRGEMVGVSQVLSPQGHEAAFAPESSQGPGQMCRWPGPVIGRGYEVPLPLVFPDLWRKEIEVRQGRRLVLVTGSGEGWGVRE